MKLKNTRHKVVSVGEVIILPDQTKEVPDSYKDNAALDCLIKKGFLEVKEDAAVIPEKPSNDDTDGKEKPISRMNKDELVAKCTELGIEVEDGDTRATMIEKINALTGTQE